MQLLKKLGARQILGDVKKVVKENCPNNNDAYQAYSVYGAVNGIKTGTSQYGEWTAFVGKLEAINHVTGEQFAAVQCFIPEPLQSLLKDGLQDKDEIEFAFSVSVKRRDDLKEGYEYLVTPHKAVSDSDPLEKLRALIPTGKQPAKLEAPKAEVKQEPKAEEKKPDNKDKKNK